MRPFDPQQIRLEPPNAKYRESYLAAMAELQTDADKEAWVYLGRDEPRDTPARDFDAYVRRLRATEKRPLPHFVRTTCYWAVYEGGMIGRVAIRHDLNEFLRRVGGHIGYIVRPSFRRLGVATEMLRQILETEQARAIGRLLLTCDEDNVASEKTIVRNGGVFENVVLNSDGPRKKRFWIDVSKGQEKAG